MEKQAVFELNRYAPSPAKYNRFQHRRHGARLGVLLSLCRISIAADAVEIASSVLHGATQCFQAA
jgi:hypothetical protein